MLGSNPSNNSLFVCPQCRGELIVHSEYYHCDRCTRAYPIVQGIADFRLRPDRYLTLEQEREKALRIANQADASFESMLDFYYQITDDVPSALANRYKAYHHNGPQQAVHLLRKLETRSNDTLLDVGCGSGGALIAAAKQCEHLFGMDIALRWLIICQQRLKEHGVAATLVCADIENPPFRTLSFSKIIANDLLENVYSVDDTLRSLSALLLAQGKLWIAGSNRYCVGPHPTTRLWAIGYLPTRLRKKVVRYFRGVDSLRFIHLISPLAIARSAKQLNLQCLSIAPKTVGRATANYPIIDRLLIHAYRIATRLPLARQLLIWIGPAFEMVFEKSSSATQSTSHQPKES